MLSLSEAGFTQSFDLWTLERVPPSPAVLYRDPTSSSVSGTTGQTFHVAFTNPSDGFSSSDDATVSSAELTDFAPDGSHATPGDPGEAYLVVGLQSSSPNTSYGQPDWGHYFAGFTPLPGSRLSFTPTGGTAVTASSSTSAFSSSDAAANDDGLFDALYWFAVPATTTGGTLSVSAGPVSGLEYVGFDGANGAGPIDVSAPATVALSFPAVPAPPKAQRRPPWVGAPLPATGLAAAADGAGRRRREHRQRFPALAGARTGGTRRCRGRRRSAPAPAARPGDRLAAAERSRANLRRPRIRRAPRLERSDPIAPSRSVADPQDADRPAADSPTAVRPVELAGPSDGRRRWRSRRSRRANRDAAPPEPIRAPADAEIVVKILGPVVVTGLRNESNRRIVEELLVYLRCHDSHHRSAEQIQAGIWPLAGSHEDVARKTFHNYLSELRGCVGSEHLPDASVAGGYLVVGVRLDWADFERLNREADVKGGAGGPGAAGRGPRARPGPALRRA